MTSTNVFECLLNEKLIYYDLFNLNGISYAYAAGMGLFDSIMKKKEVVGAEAHENAEAWYNKGNALGNLGRYQEALACYNKAIEINPPYQSRKHGNGIG